MTLQSKTFEDRSATGGARRWPAIWSVMAGIFVIVTAEILPIGLLLPISAEFAVSAGTCGLLMMVPGLVAAVAAPVVTVATARVDRRMMLSVWMVVLAASPCCATSRSARSGDLPASVWASLRLTASATRCC